MKNITIPLYHFIKMHTELKKEFRLNINERNTSTQIKASPQHRKMFPKRLKIFSVEVLLLIQEFSLNKILEYDIILLLSGLEGDMKICSTQKIHVAWVRKFVPPRKFMSSYVEARGISGWNKSSYILTNWAINGLSYRKPKHDVIRRI